MATQGSARPSDGGASASEHHLKSRPTLKELVEELDSVVSNWERFCIQLGMEKKEVDKAKVNNRDNVDAQKMEAFDKWLRATPTASWKNVIDALYDIEEKTLASQLERKYAWEDPRIKVNGSFISASGRARISAQRFDDRVDQRFLPRLNYGLEYYILHDDNVERINQRTADHRMATFSRLLQTSPPGRNLVEYFKKVEQSDSKKDFKVGFEASVKSSDVKRLCADREMLGKGPITRITLKFSVEGKNPGVYSAVIASYDDGEMFYLDAVYRKSAVDNKARLTVAMPGRKYDFRIGDCTECVLLAEHKNSVPHQLAREITDSMCQLPHGKINLKLRGSLSDSKWKVLFIRQRLQKQYKWKPERKWILATYDVDVFDSETNRTVEVDTAPLNSKVDIEFNYSRKEVELWGQKIFPKDVSDTHPSLEKYYYMEGVDGVMLPKEGLREPLNWTTEELLEYFEEFVGDVFRIAHILDGTPY